MVIHKIYLFLFVLCGLVLGSCKDKQKELKEWNDIGESYCTNSVDAPNYSEAIKWFRKAAEGGYAEAQYNLGLCYGEGLGVTKNATEALKWNRKAADQGLSIAQYNVGVYYEHGLGGVKQDYEEAVKWYQKAAEQGDPDALNNLGVCYANGQGVEKDLSKAAELYRKAADLGNYLSMFNLGFLLIKSNATPRYSEEGFQYIHIAARNGIPQAQYVEGDIEYDHNNYREAARWYLMALENPAGFDVKEVQFMLGECYRELYNYREAIEWYSKAAANGHIEAQQKLNILKQREAYGYY